MRGDAGCNLPLNLGKAQCFSLAFHTRLTLRASWYAPPDTVGIKFAASCLRTIAINRRCSLNLSDCTFLRENFLYLQAPRPSPMRGRWHGEAVTDEVGAVPATQRCPPHQSPPATASPHRGSLWSAQIPSLPFQGRWLGEAVTERSSQICSNLSVSAEFTSQALRASAP